jgi:GNAT superfamily N-acetyltransferase
MADRLGDASMTTIFEAASPEDIAQTRALFEDYAAWLGFSLAYQDFDRELSTLPGLYAPPDGMLLLARFDGAPAGCGAFRPLEPGICEMKRLYVRPALRGEGMGRLLAGRLIEGARARGYGAMRLDTMSGRMREAYGLYLSLGFREIPAYCANPFADASYLELRLPRQDGGV